MRADMGRGIEKPSDGHETLAKPVIDQPRIADGAGKAMHAANGSRIPRGGTALLVAFGASRCAQRGDDLAAPLAGRPAPIRNRLAIGNGASRRIKRAACAPACPRPAGIALPAPSAMRGLVEHRFRQVSCAIMAALDAAPHVCPALRAEESGCVGPGVERLPGGGREHFPGARTMVLSSDLIIR